MRQKLLHILAVLILVVVALHLVAFQYSLYWHFWWYDIVVHFLGGLFAGLLSAWIVFYSGYIRDPRLTRWSLFLAIILGTLAIGVGWEVFERLLGHTWSPEGYWLDTSTDVLMDVLGGLLCFLFLARNIAVDTSLSKPLV